MEGDTTAPPPGPPDDPAAWTDDEWLAWLEATDDDAGGGAAPTGSPARLQRSAGGQLLGNAMVGVANALYGRKEQDVVIVVEAGEPEDDEPFSVHLDPDRPERSTVVHKRRP